METIAASAIGASDKYYVWAGQSSISFCDSRFLVARNMRKVRFFICKWILHCNAESALSECHSDQWKLGIETNVGFSSTVTFHSETVAALLSNRQTFGQIFKRNFEDVSWKAERRCSACFDGLPQKFWREHSSGSLVWPNALNFGRITFERKEVC